MLIGAPFGRCFPPRRYTANLAAFFNRPAYTIHGPADIAELFVVRKICYADPNAAWFGPYLENATAQVITPPASVVAVIDRNAWCYARLRDRTVDAWYGGIDPLHSYKLSKCSERSDLVVNPNIAIMPSSLGFVRGGRAFLVTVLVLPCVVLVPCYPAILHCGVLCCVVHEPRPQEADCMRVAFHFSVLPLRPSPVRTVITVSAKTSTPTTPWPFSNAFVVPKGVPPRQHHARCAGEHRDWTSHQHPAVPDAAGDAFQARAGL